MNLDYSPKRSFRWILEIPGIRSFLVDEVVSAPDGKMIIGIYWLEDQKWPDEPTGNSGELKFLDEVGNVVNRFEITFSRHEMLHFNLRYSDGNGMKPKIILHDVVLRQS